MIDDPVAALRAAQAALEVAGSPSPETDASALMDIIQGDDPPWTPLSDAQQVELNRLIQRRARGEPISHIRGMRAFWMHDFIVSPDVLDPRPDTETLVEVSLTQPFTRVLDLGTGSGCILLSLLHERPETNGTGVDISEAALAVARRNAMQISVAERCEFIESDWFAAVEGKFDLIVSNPPYIDAETYATLDKTVRNFEPRIALTPGGDGLEAYRIISAQAADYLLPGGAVIVEIGFDQGQSVMNLFAQAGFADVTCHQDLNGKDRVICAKSAQSG